MSSAAIARMPLERDHLPRIAGLEIVPVQPREIINLRGQADDPVFIDAVLTATGAALPGTPNTCAAGAGTTVLWAGPDEWLVVVDPDGPEDRVAALRDALGTTRSAVTSMGAGYAVLELVGDATRDVLSRGTPLDLHADVFGPGQCAQTRLGHATVMLWQTDASPTYRLMIRRSMAGYLRDWLTAVAVRMDG